MYDSQNVIVKKTEESDIAEDQKPFSVAVRNVF